MLGYIHRKHKRDEGAFFSNGRKARRSVMNCSSCPGRLATKLTHGLLPAGRRSHKYQPYYEHHRPSCGARYENRIHLGWGALSELALLLEERSAGLASWGKGHQGKGTGFGKLPLPAQLSCEADGQAGKPQQETKMVPTQRQAHRPPRSPAQPSCEGTAASPKLKHRLSRLAKDARLYS